MSQAKEICDHYDRLKSKRSNADNTAQEIVDFILPFYPDINRLRSPGERKTDKIFDSVAGYGLHTFSQFVQGSVINPATEWYGLKHRDEEVNESAEGAAWLKSTSTKALRLMRKCFYSPAGEAIMSWAAFGNGPLLIEDVSENLKTRSSINPIRYTSVPFGQWVGCEGPDGRIDQFIRSLKLPAQTIKRLRPAGKFSDALNKALEKEPLKEFEILHSIMPRELQEYSKSKIKTAKEYDFASCWVEKEKQVVIEEGGYRKFPVAIARFDTIAGETYARGIAELALPDSKSLNLADHKALLKWDRELDPPTLTKRNSLVSKILDKRAGGNTMVNDVNNSVRPIYEQSNWMAHDQMAERKTESILRILHIHEIVRLLEREKPEMTAFEWNGRLALLQQILGPVFGLLESDFLSVIVEVTTDNMAHLRLLDDPPDEIATKGGDLIDIVYEGPIARAQRQGEIAAIQQSVADVAGIQPFYPEVVKLPDWEAVARRLWNYRGTQDLLVDARDFEARVTKMYEQANAEKAAALAGAGAQALGAAAPGLKVLGEQAGGGQRQAA